MPTRTLPSLLTLLLLLVACARGGASDPTPGAAALPSPPPTRNVPPAPPTLEPGTFVNPVIDQDFADPDLLRVGDLTYAYATNTGSHNLRVARSDDLVSWEILPDGMPALPSWSVLNSGFVWAPEVTASADGSSYLLYFTARYDAEGESDRQCIGVATSPSPEGPFMPVGDEPFVCQLEEGGSIDASTFVAGDGSRYLLWKSDANCCGGDPSIYIQPLSNDGLQLQGEPTRLLTRDQGWEGRVIEAPTLWEHEGRYYLFYSANDYAGANYAIGYATSDSLLGPYAKADGPWMMTDMEAGVVGPGGQDIVLDAQGEPWLVYHSWAPRGYRDMRIDELLWESGRPVLRGPERGGQPLPAVESR